MRLEIIDALAKQIEPSSTTEVRNAINKPRASVDRELQALHMLGVAVQSEHPLGEEVAGKVIWVYELAEGINPEALVLPELDQEQETTETPSGTVSRKVTTPPPPRKGGTTTDKSGDGPKVPCWHCGARFAGDDLEPGANGQLICDPCWDRELAAMLGTEP